MQKNKWLLLDFGGCIDSDGIHSRFVFYHFFIKHIQGLQKIPIEFFHDAYTICNNELTQSGFIKNSKLIEMNHTMCKMILNNLIRNKIKTKPEEVANSITQFQEFYLKRNKHVFERLSVNFNLGIVSNFSGNLEIILKEYQLLKYFHFHLDSFYFQVEKPNLNFFQLAINSCQQPTQNICFIGDNIERDIIPAKKLLLKTILISEATQSSPADKNITSLVDLPATTSLIFPQTDYL